MPPPPPPPPQLQRANKGNGSANEANGSASDTTAPPISSNGWVQPANGRLTSTFGYRSYFTANEFHPGVDIANRAANVPIYAAADGVVIRSNYTSGGYGNAIFIAHSINGQAYATIYGHLSSRFVQNGETVKAGQQIGIMGSTGNSTGPHLHFELHKGGYKGYGVNAIDPVGIVPLP